jgi:hypothetical protein
MEAHAMKRILIVVLFLTLAFTSFTTFSNVKWPKAGLSGSEVIKSYLKFRKPKVENAGAVDGVGNVDAKATTQAAGAQSAAFEPSESSSDTISSIGQGYLYAPVPIAGEHRSGLMNSHRVVIHVAFNLLTFPLHTLAKS